MFFCLSFCLVPLERSLVRQMAHEEAKSFSLPEGLAHRVSDFGNHYRFKVLSCANLRIGYQHGGCAVSILSSGSPTTGNYGSFRWYVFSMLGTAMYAQSTGRPFTLVPSYLVYTLVVAATCRIGRLVELLVEEYGGHALLLSGRCSGDAHPGGVHFAGNGARWLVPHI